MEENTNASQIIEEIKNSDETQLKETIERWFERTRTSGMQIGAQFISAAVLDAIQKNLKKGSSSSLRDYQRAIKRIVEIVSVQLKRQEAQQNDSADSTKENDTIEEEAV